MIQILLAALATSVTQFGLEMHAKPSILRLPALPVHHLDPRFHGEAPPREAPGAGWGVGTRPALNRARHGPAAGPPRKSGGVLPATLCHPGQEPLLLANLHGSPRGAGREEEPGAHTRGACPGPSGPGAAGGGGGRGMGSKPGTGPGSAPDRGIPVARAYLVARVPARPGSDHGHPARRPA
jgi:hypothetical protein